MLIEMMIVFGVMLGICAVAFSYLSNVESYRNMLIKVSICDVIAKWIEI